MKGTFFQKLPIQQKLVLLSIAIAGGALFVFVLVSAFNQIRIMRQGMLENLTILSVSIAELSSAALSFTDRDGAADILSTLRADPDLEVAVIYDSSGVVFATYFNDDGGVKNESPLQLSAETTVRYFLRAGRYKLEIFQPISLQGKRLGTLYLLSDTGRMTGQMFNSLLLLLLGMVVVLAATVVVSNRLQGLITRPVSILARTARSISEKGDYGLRVEKSSDDEIGQLIDDFNTMLAGIQERDAELQQHRQNLEVLVKERTEELRAKRDQALAAARAKSEFLANMSHEIRTPMNGVIGVLSLLRDVPMNGEYKRLLDTATRSADSLLLIINDILDFSKIDAGKITFESIPFDLRELLEETSELFIDTVNLKNLELTCYVPADIPCRIEGDPTRLRQIVTNLLSNAVKFTEQGEVRLSVSVVSRQDDRQELLFAVEDTGIGITEEATGRLFEKFTQADGSTTRKYGGTGLGLSVCKQLVEQQGGHIGVCSSPGDGTRFWFTLAFTIVEETYPLIPYKQLQGRSYLVADGNRTTIGLIEKYLTFCEARVTACYDGAGCLAVLEDLELQGETIDMLLIDQRLPGMGGLLLAETIHRDFPETAPWVLLMSTTTCTKAQLRKSGIRGTLLKPIRQLDLYTSLADATGRGKRRKSATVEVEQIPTIPQLRGSVLLVDDEPINQKIAMAILQKYGLVAEVAGSGREAVRMTAKKNYSVVLMDIQMPEMSGYEATTMIREREKLHSARRTVIIAMTANAMETTRKRCFEVGMDDFFTKPIKPNVLAERLLPWLEPESAGVARNVGEPPMPEPAATGTSSPAEVPGQVWSLETALGFVGGDQGLFRELVELFMRRNDTLLAAIENGIAAGDARGVRDAAHAYKGAVSHFAAQEVRKLAIDLENLGKNGESTAGMAIFLQLREASARLLQQLAEYSGQGRG